MYLLTTSKENINSFHEIFRGLSWQPWTIGRCSTSSLARLIQAPQIGVAEVCALRGLFLLAVTIKLSYECGRSSDVYIGLYWLYMIIFLISPITTSPCSARYMVRNRAVELGDIRNRVWQHTHNAYTHQNMKVVSRATLSGLLLQLGK